MYKTVECLKNDLQVTEKEILTLAEKYTNISKKSDERFLYLFDREADSYPVSLYTASDRDKHLYLLGKYDLLVNAMRLFEDEKIAIVILTKRTEYTRKLLRELFDLNRLAKSYKALGNILKRTRLEEKLLNSNTICIGNRINKLNKMIKEL